MAREQEGEREREREREGEGEVTDIMRTLEVRPQK